MADPVAGWAGIQQENEFPNFPANDSFNLNEMTGFDGMALESFHYVKQFITKMLYKYISKLLKLFSNNE